MATNDVSNVLYGNPFCLPSSWLHDGRSISVSNNDDIRNVALIGDCKKMQLTSPPIELLAVKAESLYMSVADGGAVRSCQ